MRLSIQEIHCDVRKDLLNYAETLLNKMGEKHTEITDCKLNFKESEDGKGKKKSATIYLDVPGYKLYSHSRDDSFERALAGAYKKIEHQLGKSKGKLVDRYSGHSEPIDKLIT